MIPNSGDVQLNEFYLTTSSWRKDSCCKLPCAKILCSVLQEVNMRRDLVRTVVCVQFVVLGPLATSWAMEGLSERAASMLRGARARRCCGLNTCHVLSRSAQCIVRLGLCQGLLYDDERRNWSKLQQSPKLDAGGLTGRLHDVRRASELHIPGSADHGGRQVLLFCSLAVARGLLLY